MTYKPNIDITVIGGGIVGLSTAALLSEAGFSIAVIDAGKLETKPFSTESPYDLRVSAMNLASMQIFRHLGIEDKILSERASAYTQMHIWDENSLAKIDFHADDAQQEQLGYIIENNIIINNLTNLLKEKSNVNLRPNTTLKSLEVSHDGIHLNLGNKTLHTQLLIGADGQYSKVRSLSKIPTELGSFNQSAIVCRIQTEQAHQQSAFQCFHLTGPIAYLPLNDGSSSIVWSCDTDYAKQILALSDDEFALAVEQAMQSKLGAVKLLSPRAGFDLAQQHAQTYLASKTVLVGDAAHRTHPLAGLGANLGLQDAAVLAETLISANERKGFFNQHSTLRRYERIRKHQNALVLDAMQAFKSGFGSDAASASSVREFAFNRANQFAPLKNLLSRLATGISGDFPEVCKPKW